MCSNTYKCSYRTAAATTPAAPATHLLQALQELGVLRIDKGRRAAPQRPPLLDSFDLEGVAARIKAGKAKHIIVMVRITADGHRPVVKQHVPHRLLPRHAHRVHTRCIHRSCDGCGVCTHAPALCTDSCARTNAWNTQCGAGVSVSAGIPDFRSPGTGLYSQVWGRFCT